MRTTARKITVQRPWPAPVSYRRPEERCPECHWFLDDDVCGNRLCPAFGQVQDDDESLICAFRTCSAHGQQMETDEDSAGV